MTPKSHRYNKLFLGWYETDKVCVSHELMSSIEVLGSGHYGRSVWRQKVSMIIGWREEKEIDHCRPMQNNNHSGVKAIPLCFWQAVCLRQTLACNEMTIVLEIARILVSDLSALLLKKLFYFDGHYEMGTWIFGTDRWTIVLDTFCLNGELLARCWSFRRLEKPDLPLFTFLSEFGCWFWWIIYWL